MFSRLFVILFLISIVYSFAGQPSRTQLYPVESGYIFLLEEVEFHELTPVMIAELVDQVKDYNQIRQKSADYLQRKFNKLASNEIQVSDVLLEINSFERIHQIAASNDLLRNKFLAVQAAINFDSLRIPEIAIDPIETRVYLVYHKDLVKHYLNQYYHYPNRYVYAEIELMLGSEYADYISEFWRIYRQESHLMNYLKNMISQNRKLTPWYYITWQVYVVDAKEAFRKIFGIKHEDVLDFLFSEEKDGW